VRILTTLSRPDGGQAAAAGIDVLRHPGRVRSVIGAVSQRSGALTILTGYENLALQGRVYRMRGSELRSRVTELLEQFGLAEAANRQVRTYSGGMRRRLDVHGGLLRRLPRHRPGDHRRGLHPGVPRLSALHLTCETQCWYLIPGNPHGGPFMIVVS
jgi:ABC-type lipopolysaccharide export system ATPase subunit